VVAVDDVAFVVVALGVVAVDDVVAFVVVALGVVVVDVVAAIVTAGAVDWRKPPMASVLFLNTAWRM